MPDNNKDSIQLDQFLKLQQLVSSGGQAKHEIQEGNVKVNGQIETRRGRKLQNGDIVEFSGKICKVTST